MFDLILLINKLTSSDTHLLNLWLIRLNQFLFLRIGHNNFLCLRYCLNLHFELLILWLKIVNLANQLIVGFGGTNSFVATHITLHLLQFDFHCAIHFFEFCLILFEFDVLIVNVEEQFLLLPLIQFVELVGFLFWHRLRTLLGCYGWFLLGVRLSISN